MFSFLKRKKQVNRVSRRATRQTSDNVRLTHKQYQIYKTVKELNERHGPVNARMVEDLSGWRGGSVTPRIAELKRKGLIEIPYVKKGLDGRKVSYYHHTKRKVSGIV